MIGFSHTPKATQALLQWRSRSIFPTEFSSRDIRMLSRELRLRSVFSARMTNAKAVQSLADIVDKMLSGDFNQAEGRYRMLCKLKELGYDPQTGFPQDMANVPPAERDSLRDLSSERRLNLMLETNERMAANYGSLKAGNTDYALHWYPAWELIRLYIREVPRGTPESHSEGWERRWDDAGEAVSWEGALHRPMVARKDSPIWEALGDGEGGYADALHNPFPPFAFNSGMAWKAVPRKRCVALGLIHADESSLPGLGSFDPTEQEFEAEMSNLSPDLEAEMRRILAA